MHSLFERNGFAIPSLYVKSAPQTYDIRRIFLLARRMSPCLLIFEDIDTIVTPSTRSYFFNEVDGLENNDGLFMVASTNHLDQLDPGLSSRPSRFDRKYLFPLPDLQQRVDYCEYWRKKLEDKPTIKFPEKLCLEIAKITKMFSFAYLKEAFVASLLTIAGRRSEDDDQARRQYSDGDGDDLDQYELWREMKKQIKLLRDDMDSKAAATQLRSLPSVPIEGPSNDGISKDSISNESIPNSNIGGGMPWKQGMGPNLDMSTARMPSHPFHHHPQTFGLQGLPCELGDYQRNERFARSTAGPSIEHAMLDLKLNHHYM